MNLILWFSEDVICINIGIFVYVFDSPDLQIVELIQYPSFKVLTILISF